MVVWAMWRATFFPLERNEFSIWYYRVQSAIEFQLTKRFVKKNDLWLLQFKKRRLEWRCVWFWILWLEAFDTVCRGNGANKSFVRLDFAIRILQKNFAWKFLQKNFPWIVCEDRRSGKISEKSFAKELWRRNRLNGKQNEKCEDVEASFCESLVLSGLGCPAFVQH